MLTTADFVASLDPVRMDRWATRATERLYVRVWMRWNFTRGRDLRRMRDRVRRNRAERLRRMWR